jgi:hypothetical protein
VTAKQAGLKTRLDQREKREQSLSVLFTIAVVAGAASSVPAAPLHAAGPEVATTAVPIVGAASSVPAAPAAVEVTLRDLEGRSVRPFDTPAAAFAFVFLRTDCPISNRYAPEVTRLHGEFVKRGVAVYFVYPGAQAAPDIRRHVKEFGYPGTPLLDPRMRLVDAAGVTVTPEAAIYDRSRSLVYHGRLDDRYVDIGRYRPEPTTRDVRDVLTALVAGRPAPYASRPAVGCFVEDLR